MFRKEKNGINWVKDNPLHPDNYYVTTFQNRDSSSLPGDKVFEPMNILCKNLWAEKNTSAQ